MGAGHACWTDAGSEQGARVRAVFAIEGMRCAACAAAIERALRSLEGIGHASVNVATARAAVAWDPERLTLGRILRAVSAAGFRPLPLGGEASAAAQREERRRALKRVGLAGLGMMQIMMLVYGLYAPGTQGIDEHLLRYLRLAAMLLATPVILYAGTPFFRRALRDIGRRRLGMDVPVALAVALAFAASVVNTLRGRGEIYFDSAAMFVFFLLTGRFLEMTVRHRSVTSAEALARSVPATAVRLTAHGGTERIPLEQLAAGERILVARGAVVPVDGILESAEGHLDEALVTGESSPVTRHSGEALLGGSVNAGHAIEVTARARAADSTLATLVALLERAQSERPRLARLADRVASWFVLATLLLAAGVAALWLVLDPPRAFGAALAVLVVTCPCALSLATPAAAAAACARLVRAGLLVTRADALERLAGVTTLVIDKTGTLTVRAEHAQLAWLRPGTDAHLLERIAGALERGSEHPLAAAFAPLADAGLSAAELREWPGAGIEGRIEGVRWRLGTRAFVCELAAASDANANASAQGAGRGSDGEAGTVYLGSGQGVQAAFTVADELRPGARAAVEAARGLGLEVMVASGDREQAVGQAARALGLPPGAARLDPQQKIALVRQLQQRGARVLMVGDGINDGPVLAAADVSCALAQGSGIAHAAADLLLLNESLGALPEAIRTARRMLRVMRQNLAWAFAYNVTAVPLAALGFVPPWLAALGMSASSLVVALNAARLARGGALAMASGCEPPSGARQDASSQAAASAGALA